MAVLAAERSKHERDWSRFSRLLISAAIVLFVLTIAFLLTVDPYDSGRTGLLGRTGVPQQSPGTANASRVRDPAFNAAIVGNSHIQLINPERLDAQTGLVFVSLFIPATGPSDHLTILKRFLEARPAPPKAIVIGTDYTWCMPTMTSGKRFPA